MAETFQYPHCDQDVLHFPGTCIYCDMSPDLQNYRQLHSINFTGIDDKDKSPCPSDAKRGLAGAHVWGGNTPKAAGCTCGMIKLEYCPICEWCHGRLSD